MLILDNLYFYLFLWFKRKDKILKASMASERVSYLIGIVLEIWLITITRLIEFTLNQSFKSRIPIMFYIISSLFFIWLIDYIYIKKNRYNKIMKEKRFISEKIGIAISITFSFLSLIIPMIVFILLSFLNWIPRSRANPIAWRYKLSRHSSPSFDNLSRRR